jgi:membrane protein DedA with SNARE-associated domain
MSHISQFLLSHGGLVLFLMVFAEQSGLPLPAAPFLLTAGALAASGRINLFAAIGWATVASLAADTFWFYAGHRSKARLFQRFPHWHAVRDTVARKAQLSLILRGIQMLTAAKFLPLGILVPLRAGALDVGPLRFLPVDGVCSLFYASLYVLPGFFLHDQLEQVVAFVQRLGVFTFLLLLALVGGYLSYDFLKRRRRKVSKSIPSGPTLSQASDLVVCLAPSRTFPEVTCAPNAQTQNQS